MPDPARVERFRRARRDRALAVLEGVHALKHALRFGAEPVETVTDDPERLDTLARRLAPDVADRISRGAVQVPVDVFQRLSPHPPRTGVIAVAPRPDIAPAEVLDDPTAAPIVLLDRPRHLGNLGAAIRVAAAAGARALLTTGEHDPWHPTALRGAAGLHYAVAVARVDGAAAGGGGAGVDGPRATGGARGVGGRPAGIDAAGRPLVAVDPGGEPLTAAAIPPRALLAFGSERHGLDDALLATAERRVRIPMRTGVSSLNLATAVAVVLYTWRLRGRT